MTLIRALPVPGLTRDLLANTLRGLETSSGRDLRFANLAPARLAHGAFCLHHGFTPMRRTLHRSHERPARPYRSTQSWPIQTHSKIQYQTAGLVRTTRGFRTLSVSRTLHKTVETRQENSTYHKCQSELAGHNHPNSVLSHRKVPAQGRDGWR